MLIGVILVVCPDLS
jgi:methionyl aminopeptidase